jgi:hypothetical protein
MASLKVIKRSHAVSGAVMDKVDRNIANVWGERLPCVVEYKLYKQREEGQHKLCQVAERREMLRQQWCATVAPYFFFTFYC